MMNTFAYENERYDTTFRSHPVTVKFKFKIKWLFISSANELVRAC